jgi:hypothetical protein
VRHLDKVVLEEISYMPSNRNLSGINVLYQCYGEILGMLKTLRIPYLTVRPISWQPRLFGKLQHDKGDSQIVRRKRIKRATLAWINATLPTAPIIPELCRVPHDGIVDALALAYYGYLDHTNQSLANKK